MTDTLQTIALACGFLPAIILLWFRVGFLKQEVEELQQQALTAMLADEIRRGYRHDFIVQEGSRYHEYDN